LRAGAAWSFREGEAVEGGKVKWEINLVDLKRDKSR
jgi:hypothetical protein